MDPQPVPWDPQLIFDTAVPSLGSATSQASFHQGVSADSGATPAQGQLPAVPDPWRGKTTVDTLSPRQTQPCLTVWPWAECSHSGPQSPPVLQGSHEVWPRLGTSEEPPRRLCPQSRPRPLRVRPWGGKSDHCDLGWVIRMASVTGAAWAPAVNRWPGPLPRRLFALWEIRARRAPEAQGSCTAGNAGPRVSRGANLSGTPRQVLSLAN